MNDIHNPNTPLLVRGARAPLVGFLEADDVEMIEHGDRGCEGRWMGGRRRMGGMRRMGGRRRWGGRRDGNCRLRAGGPHHDSGLARRGRCERKRRTSWFAVEFHCFQNVQFFKDKCALGGRCSEPQRSQLCIPAVSTQPIHDRRSMPELWPVASCTGSVCFLGRNENRAMASGETVENARCLQQIGGRSALWQNPAGL